MKTKKTKNHIKIIKFITFIIIIAAVFMAAGAWLTRPALAGWWPDGGTSWLNRKQLTLTNNSGGNLNANAVVTITVDTQSLYTLGKLKSDCSDLRILYHPSATTNKELTRYVGFPSGTTCTTSTSSKVSFALQASLANSSNSTNYYLYYNNPDATAPTNNQTAFSVGSATATFVCSFDGSSTCLAAGTATPSTETGAIRYSGSKSALSFDGKSDKVDGSTIVQTSGTQFTAEFWTNIPDITKYDSASTDVRFFDAWSSGQVSLKIFNSFGGSSNRRMYFSLNTTGGNVTVTNCDISALSSNSWHHIAAVYNGTTMYVYIDGTSCGSAAQSGTVNITSQNLSIGASYDSAYLGTVIDEFRISNTARYTAAFTPQTSPFVRDSNTKLLLHFDENGDDPRNTGKTIDDSGNGYHGTITGAKYVAGLVGVDASTSNTGNIPRQSYAGHEGVMLEEATTNKITNPSFENATYDTNWTGAASGTITLQPDPTAGIDNMVAEGGQANNNYGTTTLLYNQNNAGTQTYNPYKFDLSSIPAGSTITSATMTLWTYSTAGTGNLNVYRILAADSAWTESGSTWNYAVASSTRWAGDTGADGGSDAGGSVSGTDHSSTLMGSVALTNGEAANTQKDITLDTTEFATMFANNYGLYARKDSDGYGIFYSSDYTTDTTKRPKLVVNYNAPFTLTQNTTAPYVKFGSNSAKVVAGADGTFTTSINPGNTNTHMLSAYVYDGTSGNVGGTVGATVAKLVYRGTAQTTTYTDMGGGWWRLSYSAAAANAAENYGVQVLSGKTVYIDGVQLEEKAYATTYADGSLGTGYAWTGTANNSTSTRAAADLRYANASNVSATAGSASFWIKTPWAGNDGVAHTIADFQTSAGTLRIQKNAANNIILYDGTNTASKAVTWAANSWNHITVDWGSSNMHVYVNSTAGTAAGAFSAPTLSTSMFVGQDTSNANLGDAVVSDFRIYNAVLSANDVSDLYYAGLVSHSENIAIDRFGGGDTKGQDPLAVWHMDEGYGTTVNDSSRNAKPLTASGATWESGFGNTRSARARFLKFDGSTSYLSRAQDSGFDFGTGSFSVSGWFHHISTAPASGTHTILARYGSAGFKMYMNTSGYICFGIDADSTWSPADTACSGTNEGSLADSKWHHVEAVKNGTTSISLYIDGHLAQTTTITATGSMNTSSILYLGVDSTGNSNYWNGWLDEFMVYPYARSAAQAKVDANASTAVLSGVEGSSLTQGLVGYWKMDESSGNAADSSGNAYTLTNNATATFAAGKYANAGSLASASSQYFNTATNMGNIQTTSFWVNPTSTTTYLVDINGTQTITAAGTLAANSFTGATIYVNGAISSTITANVWQHVVVTSTTAYAASAFAVGKVGANYLNGAIDDVRIYNRALSPREVRDLYNWAPGPVGYWNMDEGTVGNANDLSGNGYTGTNTGTTVVSGKYGKSRNFNGSTDKIAVSSTIPGTQTVGFWVNPTSTTSNMVALTSGAYVSASSGTITATGFTSPTIYVNGVVSSTLTANVWQYVAVTTGTAISANAINFGLANSVYFSGKLDDVKIYNYARSQKQVVEDMNAGHPSVGSPVGSAVGYWKLDEGADNTCSGGANDACNSGSAGSALDGPQTGMATPATATSGWTNSGKFGKALLFDGTDDKIAIPDHANFTLPGDFTIDAWIKTTSSTGTILGSYTNTGDIYWQFENSGGHPQLLYKATAFGSTQSILGAGKLINDGAWHHVVGIRDGSTLYTYVDGVLDNTATGKLTTSINPVNPTNIGNSTTPANYFTGTIDEVKLYHYALTADEVKLDYNRGSTLVLGSLGDNSSYQKQAANQEYCAPGDTTSCVTPLAEWKFDEGTSTSAFDSTGNGVKGTLVNSPAWIAGKVGKALNFNGSNSYVTTTHQDALFNTITTAMTISGWFKPAAGSLSSRRDLIQRAGAVGSINGASAAKDIWWFNLQNSGKMNFYMGGITGAYVETTTAISDSVWTYLTVTYDGSNIRFYINGKLDKTSAASGTLLTGDNGVGIGGNLSGVSPATVFSGGIDALRVWGYARSPAQVAYDYNRGGPMAQYKFDECTGATANDASGNGNTGTITVGASGSQTSTGTCGTSTTTEAWSNGTTGKRNASINLDGNDDYVTTAAFSPLATAAVTTTKASWGGWFYPTSSAASLTLMEKATEFRLTTDANSKPVCGISSASFATNLISYWKLEEASGSRADEVGGNTLTDNNTVTQAAGKLGNAAQFTLGNSEWLSITDNAALSLGGDTSFTLTAWVYADTIAGSNPRIISKDDTGNREYLLSLLTAGSKFVFAFWDAGSVYHDVYANTFGAISTSTWYWVAVRYDAATNVLGISVNNGVADTGSFAGGVLDAAAPFLLGSYKGGGSFWNGRIDSVGIWKRALSDAELTSLYNGGTGLEATAAYHDAAAGSTALTLSAWNHVMCTYDGANIKTYLNGSLVGTTANTNNITAASSILYMGENSSGAQRVTGQLDDVRVYNYALTASQIKTLINEGAIRFGPATGSP